MNTALHHIHAHLKRHHRKYLLGIFGGYAIVKLFLLLFSISIIGYGLRTTFAELFTGCVLTGQYYTGEYATGGYLTGQELTGGYLTGCSTVPGYRTGGSLDESGNLTGQTWVEESQTGCFLEGQELTGGYFTGQELTGGYRTGGYYLCPEETGTVQTGTVETGTVETGTVETGTVETGTIQTGTIQTGTLLQSGTIVCESSDILRSFPSSGSTVGNTIPIAWSYSGTDCLTGLTLQLRDHNSQRITLKVLNPGITGYLFDSRSLASFQQSGFYHIIGTGTTGQYYLYTGSYTGTYTRLFSGYKLRLIDSAQSTIYESQPFIINNEAPSLSNISLLSSGSSSGYVALSGTVDLTFTSNQSLSGILVLLGSGIAPTTSLISGSNYRYSWVLSSGTAQGPLAVTIAYANAFGNTGSSVYTSSLIFDTVLPVLGKIAFSGHDYGAYLTFTASEPVLYTLSYQTAGGASFTGSSADYLTAQIFNFTGLQKNQLYTFTMNVFDRAGNSRTVTGDLLQTSLGTLLSHVYVLPISTTIKEVALSGTLSSLAVVLKAEIEKFNACKNALSYTPIELTVRGHTFSLQMPLFKKSEMKTLVNAFTLFILDKVKHNASLSSDEIVEITRKFDNFLVILKLLRDDDNACKQNLSNYHISQFQNALDEYHITLQ